MGPRRRNDMDFGLLQKKFLACVPIDQWTKDIATESTQQDVLAATVRSEILQGKPISPSYVSHFMKTFMAKIEEFGGQIYDGTFEAYGDVLTLLPPTVEYRHYLLNDKVISLQETSSLVAEGTTGLKTWQASQYLVEYLVENHHLVDRKNILELGSGLGLLGLSLCSLYHCSNYILSDHHPSVLQKLHANVAINTEGLLCVPSVQELDWQQLASGETEEQLKSTLNKVDVILAADVVYDVDIIPSLVSTLKVVLSLNKGDCSAIVASTIRNEDTYGCFIKEMEGAGLWIEKLTSSAAKVFVYDETSPLALVHVYLSKPS